MPSNKTLLIWIVATNLFWAGCITATFYSVSKRDTKIAELQAKDDEQEQYDVNIKERSLIVFQILQGEIMANRSDIEALQKECSQRPKVKFQ